MRAVRLQAVGRKRCLTGGNAKRASPKPYRLRPPRYDGRPTSAVLVALAACLCVLLRRAVALAAVAVPVAIAAGLAALAPDGGHVFPIPAYGFAAFPADLGHMLAVLADRFATLA